jgi:FkbM family methyltransferase
MTSPEHVALAIELAKRICSDGTIDCQLFCVEVGARKPASGELSREPFYQLPKRQILSFEADDAEAQRLQKKFGPDTGIEVVPCALGAKIGVADLYLTRNPKCSSLYEPNKELISRYPRLDVALPERIVQVQTTTLDAVTEARAWDRIDFVKMDVQGGELDIVRGGARSLADILAIVGEVSFSPIYLGQPLFGDISAALTMAGLEFHGFIQLGGMARTTTRSDQAQVLWGDGLWLRAPETLDKDQAARLAVLATLYGRLDVAEVAMRRVGGPIGDWFVNSITPTPPSALATFLQRAWRKAGRVMQSVISRTAGGKSD